MVSLAMAMARVLQVTQRVMGLPGMPMVTVLQVMPRFLGTVMGGSTYPDRSLDNWKTPVKGTVSRLLVVMVRVL